MYQTILVPMDGSKRAETILSHVESIVKSNDAKVLFLKVEEEPIMLERDEVIDIAKYHEVLINKMSSRKRIWTTSKPGFMKKVFILSHSWLLDRLLKQY